LISSKQNCPTRSSVVAFFFFITVWAVPACDTPFYLTPVTSPDVRSISWGWTPPLPFDMKFWNKVLPPPAGFQLWFSPGGSFCPPVNRSVFFSSRCKFRPPYSVGTRPDPFTSLPPSELLGFTVILSYFEHPCARFSPPPPLLVYLKHPFSRPGGVLFERRFYIALQTQVLLSCIACKGFFPYHHIAVCTSSVSSKSLPPGPPLRF